MWPWLIGFRDWVGSTSLFVRLTVLCCGGMERKWDSGSQVCSIWVCSAWGKKYNPCFFSSPLPVLQLYSLQETRAVTRFLKYYTFGSKVFFFCWEYSRILAEFFPYLGFFCLKLNLDATFPQSFNEIGWLVIEKIAKNYEYQLFHFICQFFWIRPWAIGKRLINETLEESGIQSFRCISDLPSPALEFGNGDTEIADILSFFSPIPLWFNYALRT